MEEWAGEGPQRVEEEVIQRSEEEDQKYLGRSVQLRKVELFFVSSLTRAMTT